MNVFTNQKMIGVSIFLFTLMNYSLSIANIMKKSDSIVFINQQPNTFIKITGTVTDAYNNPIANVKIYYGKNYTNTTFTDTSGNYALEAPANSYLVFSAEGFDTKEVKIKEENKIDIILEDSIQSLNEIVVTGRAGAGKRSKLATSYSITNIREKALRLQAPTSVTETLKSVPGFWVESSGGEASGNVRARGVPVDGYGSIQLLEDGIPVQHDPALGYLNADQVFRFDETTQNIEIVRGGPSSVFYSNAPAGAVNYIPRKVGENTEGSFKLTSGTNNLFRTDFWLGTPIDDWKLAIGGFYRTDTGVRNPGFTGNHGGQFRASIGREWDEFSFSIDFKHVDDNVILFLGIPMTYKDGKIVSVPGFDGHYGTLAGPETQKIKMIEGDGSIYNFDNTLGTSVKRNQLTAKFESTIFDNWIFKNVIRYSDTETQRNGVFPNALQKASTFLDSQKNLLSSVANADHLSFQYVNNGEFFDIANQNGNGLMVLGGIRGLTLPLKEITNDLRIARTFKTETTMHDFNVGYYFSYFEENFNRYSSTALLDVQNNSKLIDLIAVDSNGKKIETFTDNGIYRHGYEWEDAHGQQTTQALYISDEWQITDALRIDGGLRWEMTYVQGVVGQKQNINKGSFSTSNILSGNGKYLNYDNNFQHTTWTLGVNYQLSESMGAFVRYTSAARIPGLGNYVTNVNAKPIVQTMDLGEIGYKFNMNKISLYATGFWTKYNSVGFTNYVFDLNGNSTPESLYANTQTLGLELEARYYPTRWFDITLASTLQDAKYKGLVYRDASQKVNNYDGNSLIRIPAISLRVIPGFNFLDDKLRLQFPIEYEDKRYVDIANSVILPSYTKIDLNLEAKITNNISILGIVDNLNNSLGLTEGNPRQGEVKNTDALASFFIARPLIGRNYKIALSYRF